MKKFKIKRKITSNAKKLKEEVINIKNDPINYLKKLFKECKTFVINNGYFCTFVLINLLNGILIRTFTMGINSMFLFSPFIADLSLLLLLGGIGYFMKTKRQVIYYIIISFVLMLLCTINSAYYTFYTSFASISLLSTTKFIFQVGDAVVENVIKIRDIIYIILFAILILLFIKNSKKHKGIRANKTKASKIILCSFICFLMFCLTLTSTDVGRLVKQWNREYIVNKYGIYIYHINDFVKSIEPKITSLFGYDEAQKKFSEYYESKKTYNSTNGYTNIYKGKNIIGIHAESIQNFVIGLKINGKEVTPNLNKLANQGLYFDNFYSQVSVGTSSDTEFTLATSLMPSNTGTAFGNYFDRTYISMPQLLKDMGYYTFSMHGNNSDYWNRRIMHQTLGYEHFYAKSEFDIDETIGLGLSDHSFFKQSVEKLKLISQEHEKYYGTFIMLTNHTPFSDLEKYGEFDVSMTVDGVNYPYLEGTKLGNYLKSVHYADKCLGEFFDSLEENGMLDNTVIVLYGDHDARLPLEDYQKFYNYDIETDGILDETSENYKVFDNYSYELNRKVPLIIWSKNAEPKKVSYVMGMYDVMPTLGNMFGFKNEYALGHDIFNIKNDNIVVYPTGNWLTEKVYYNSQKSEYLVLKGSIISEEYIEENNKYSDKLLDVSNAIIVYDLIKNNSTENVDESKLINGN
ncbi:MAG: LTA synthase family protein [bacterium]|nr:LTA synthase family protein [bacterium]